MAKLPSISGKQAMKAFESDGFSVVRTRGSHAIMKKPGHRYVLSVPNHKTLKPGTLAGLLRAAGLTTERFVELLDD